MQPDVVEETISHENLIFLYYKQFLCATTYQTLRREKQLLQ